MIGKKIRLERIMDRNTGRMLIVPIDHGMTDGPIPGLVDVRETVASLVAGGANAVLMQKGIVGVGHRGAGSDTGLIVHLSGGCSLSPDPLTKVIVTTVEEAVQLGADAVSIHINVGAGDTPAMLRDAGVVVRDAKRFGMPVLMMMYPRGEKIKDEHGLAAVKIAARMGAELGADIVKTHYTGDMASFREVVDGCPVPVVIAGGSKGEVKDILQMISDAVGAGAAGVAMGRNCFQHPTPERFIKAASYVIHERLSVKEAMQRSGLGAEQ